MLIGALAQEFLIDFYTGHLLLVNRLDKFNWNRGWNGRSRPDGATTYA